jgi:hypothetical protein
MRCMHSHFFFKRRVAAAAVELKAPRATVPASLSLAAAGCICICICICNYIGASKKPGKKQRFPCKEFRTFAAIHPSHPPIPATHVCYEVSLCHRPSVSLKKWCKPPWNRDRRRKVGDGKIPEDQGQAIQFPFDFPHVSGNVTFHDFKID